MCPLTRCSFLSRALFPPHALFAVSISQSQLSHTPSNANGQYFPSKIIQFRFQCFFLIGLTLRSPHKRIRWPFRAATGFSVDLLLFFFRACFCCQYQSIYIFIRNVRVEMHSHLICFSLLFPFDRSIFIAFFSFFDCDSTRTLDAKISHLFMPRKNSRKIFCFSLCFEEFVFQ